MSKAKNSSKVINWIAGGALAYFIGTAIAGAIKRKRESTNGIGDLTTWNKQHLANYFERAMWGGIVVVNMGVTDERGYYPVDFHTSDNKFRYPNFTYLISPNNIEYLKELCRIYHCGFKVEHDDSVWYPNLHKA